VALALESPAEPLPKTPAFEHRGWKFYFEPYELAPNTSVYRGLLWGLNKDADRAHQLIQHPMVYSELDKQFSIDFPNFLRLMNENAEGSVKELIDNLLDHNVTS